MEVNNHYREAFESFFDPQCIIENYQIIETNKAFRALINIQNDAEPELFINDLAIDRWKSIFEENIEGMRANKIDHVSFTAFMQLNSQHQDEYQIHASSLSNNLNSGLILLTFSNITQKEKLDLIENEQRTMADVYAIYLPL